MFWLKKIEKVPKVTLYALSFKPNPQIWPKTYVTVTQHAGERGLLLRLQEADRRLGWCLGHCFAISRWGLLRNAKKVVFTLKIAPTFKLYLDACPY